MNFIITEFIPNKKVTWQVIDCYLYFIEDKHKWDNTSVSFDIIENNGSTIITMTHLGLKPGMECFEECQKGWNFYILESLYKLITTNEGMPV